MVCSPLLSLLLPGSSTAAATRTTVIKIINYRLCNYCHKHLRHNRHQPIAGPPPLASATQEPQYQNQQPPETRAGTPAAATTTTKKKKTPPALPQPVQMKHPKRDVYVGGWLLPDVSSAIDRSWLDCNDDTNITDATIKGKTKSSDSCSKNNSSWNLHNYVPQVGDIVLFHLT